MDKIIRPDNILPTESHFNIKDIHKAQIEGMKKMIFCTNKTNKRAWVTILILDKTDFK